jgi:hypothetical protein
LSLLLSSQWLEEASRGRCEGGVRRGDARYAGVRGKRPRQASKSLRVPGLRGAEEVFKERPEDFEASRRRRRASGGAMGALERPEQQLQEERVSGRVYDGNNRSRCTC